EGVEAAHVGRLIARYILRMSLVALRTSSRGGPARDRTGRHGDAAGGGATAFLPTTRDEMRARGWGELDVLIGPGDADVDHPAFGPVLVARFLEGRGYRVGIVAQPRWNDADGTSAASPRRGQFLGDVARMGRPRLFVGVAAGNLDSMLNKL